MAMYKDIFVYPWKLGDAVKSMGSKIKNTHRAIDDVLATWDVFKILFREYTRTADAYVNVFGL